MYLTNIKIAYGNGEVIRDIDFKQHLNLVIDNGKNQNTGSGNDIGKTTFLRTIDFCLGAQANELYVDRDEKRHNDETREFLTSKRVSFTLSVGRRFGTSDYILKRWFDGVDKNDKPVVSQSINGEKMGIRDYTKQLNKIFFDLETSKPSFRDLIPKFIREENNATGSLLRYLGTFKSDDEYNSIHLVLFGFRDVVLLSKKSELTTKIKELENRIKVYKNDYGNENELTAQISVLQNDIEELKSERDAIQSKLLDISNLETDLDTLNEIAERIVHLNGMITKYDIDIKNIRSNIERLKSDHADVDTRSMKLLYEETKLYNEKIHKEFEEVVAFHNTMIGNKLRFMRSALESKETKRKKLKEERKALIERYELQKNGKEEELLSKLNTLNKELVESQGKLEMLKSVLENIEDALSELQEIEEEFNKISQKLEEAKETLQNNINIFNKYFSKFTKQLYGEEYIIYLGDDLLKPFGVSAKANPGDGKKKALITAFDLAYAAFVGEVGLPYPKFIAEDQLELTDIKQLGVLFALAKEIDTQLIIPVLKSKIESIDGIKQEDILLELSQERKFFLF